MSASSSTSTSSPSQKRLRNAAAADQDPSRGGDLLRLLKPMNERKIALTTEAYTFHDSNSRIIDAVTTSKVLPEGIKMAINEAECDASMGLFPEINRAWVVVDNLLFLWNYNQPGNAYETFRSMNDQLIVSIGLCRPKSDFQAMYPSTSPYAKPDYILAVATLIDVTLLRLDKKSSASYSLLETSITVATNSVRMRHIQGSLDGRIFMGGDDGSVHELVYETKRNFLHTLGIKRQCFTVDRSSSGISNALVWVVPPGLQKLYTKFVAEQDPIVRLEVDDGRKLLYSLSKTGVISLFNIQRPDDVHFVASFDSYHLERSLDMKTVQLVGVKDVDLRTFVVSSLDVISQPTSSVHLVVVGKSGIRIFLTTCESVSAAASNMQASSKIPGKRLNPIMVRGLPERKKLYEATTRNSSARESSPSSVVIPAAFSSSLQAVLKSFSTGDVSIFAQESLIPSSSSSQSVPCADLTAFSIDLSSSDPLKWKTDFFREQIDLHVLGNPSSAAAGEENSSTMGRVYAIREDTSKQLKEMKLRMHWSNSGDRLEDATPMSELVLQHASFSKRTFLVLTSQGIRILEKKRPVDVLISLLELPKHLADVMVPQFFTRFGLDESCAMALNVACRSAFSAESNFFNQNWAQTDTSSKAGYFFSSLGFTHPSSSLSSVSNENTTNKNNILPALKSVLLQEKAKSNNGAIVAYNGIGGAAAGATRSVGGGSMSTQRAVLASNLQAQSSSSRDMANKSIEEMESEMVFSGCFEGLVLYLSRLLRPLWSWSILAKTGASYEFRWSHSELESLRIPLVRLRMFMEQHHPFRQACSNVMDGKRPQKVTTFTPSIVEEIRSGELYLVLRRAIDCVTFFLEIEKSGASEMRRFSSHFAWIFAETPQDLTEIQKVTWEEFITTEAGVRISRRLVRALLEKEKQLKQDNTFLDHLSTCCGDFFSKSYWSHITAMEEFELAKKSELSREWKSSHIGRAVSMVDVTFKAINLASSEEIRKEALERLLESSSRCCELKENWRAVQLCIALVQSICASFGIDMTKLPKRNVLSGVYAADQSPADLTSMDFRRICYQIAYDALLSAQDEMFNRCLEIVFKTSSDATMQFYFLQRLVLDQKSDLVVNLDGGFVEDFLQDKENNPYPVGSVEKHTDEHLVLYARWLACHERFMDAAKMFRRLASIDDATNVTRNPKIDRRIEYLTDAMQYDGDSESFKRSKSLAEATRDVYLALLSSTAGDDAASDDNDLLLELHFRPMKENRLYDICSERGLTEECISLLQRFGKGKDKSPQVIYDLYGELFGPILAKWDVIELKTTIQRLGKRFGSDPQVFPLNMLVESLEAASFERKRRLLAKSRQVDWPDNWLVASLELGEIDNARIFVAYARCFDRLRAADGSDKACLIIASLIVGIVRKWMMINSEDFSKYRNAPISREDTDLGSVVTFLRMMQSRAHYDGELGLNNLIEEINERF